MILTLYLTDEPEDDIKNDLYENDGMSSHPSSVPNSEPASEDEEQDKDFGLPGEGHEDTGIFFLLRL
jgi:hypothetical protein